MMLQLSCSVREVHSSRADPTESQALAVRNQGSAMSRVRTVGRQVLMGICRLRIQVCKDSVSVQG